MGMGDSFGTLEMGLPEGSFERVIVNAVDLGLAVGTLVRIVTVVGFTVGSSEVVKVVGENELDVAVEDW